MIIVSQDKKVIVNMDNIISTEVGKRKDKNEFAIIQVDVRGFDAPIAFYKTEERAKEVLQEIIKAYTSMQILPFLQANISDNLYGKDLAKVVAYEMPQE